MSNAHADLAMKRSIKRSGAATISTSALTEPRIPPRKLKLLSFLIYFVFSGLAAIVFYTMYLYWSPQHPLVVYSAKIVTPVITSPGSLTYQIDACKNTDVTPIVFRKLVQNDAGASLLATQGLAVRGCGITNVTIPIPAGLKPGKDYILYSDIDYQVNALRTVHVYWHAGPVEVQ